MATNTLAVSDDAIDRIGSILSDKNSPLKKRFRALFTLRHLGGQRSIDYIGKNFDDTSALLKHELAYCLGQMGDSYAAPILRRVLADEKQEPMVRHEAGEALGALGNRDDLALLEKYAKDPFQEVAETCQLAVERIKWMSQEGKEDLPTNPYFSIDPSPPLSEIDVPILQTILLDSNEPLWKRYRAMFTLRNLATDDAVLAIAEGLKCEDSALFRHEIAFVLGQLQSALTIDQLTSRLSLPDENCMVRHECAEALGAIATEECRKILEQYMKDEEQVVRESCQVALDMCDYENSEEFQYADGLSVSG